MVRYCLSISIPLLTGHNLIYALPPSFPPHSLLLPRIRVIKEEIEFINDRKEEIARQAVEACRTRRRRSIVATRTALLDEVHETDKLNEREDQAKEGSAHSEILKAIVTNHFLFRSFDEHSIQQLVSSAMPQKL